MDNKEIKTNMTELNDDALENVNGGNNQNGVGDTCAYNEYVYFVCANCQCESNILKERITEAYYFGKFYCIECKKKLGVGWEILMPE